jgi:predicted enzyme related to lactoylglutathione lyase
MNPVVHFEMPYEDKDRVAAFYEKVFGWKVTKLGPDMMDYVLVKTAIPSEVHDAMYKDSARGAIGGGFFPKKQDWPAQFPSVVIGVDNIKESMELVANNGGKVLGEPVNIPGTGMYVSFVDTEGNRVSILQPEPMQLSQVNLKESGSGGP